MAQNKASPNLFTVVDLPKNLTIAQAEMVAKIEKYPNLKKVTYVDIADVDKVQYRGYVSFSIPDEGVKTKINVRLKRLEITNAEKSTAYGLGMVEGEFSELMLNKEKGLVFGTMRCADKSYIIYGIGKHLSAILELDISQIAKMECGSNGDSDDKQAVNSSPTSTPELITTCQTTLATTVLILYTTAANNTDPSIFQTATNSVTSHNNILNNSAVTAVGSQLVSVGVELLHGFVENAGSITGDVNRLAANTTATFRRNATTADFVVLLTNATYLINGGQILGTVSQIDAENPNAYAIVEAPFAVEPSSNTFSHEVGHLFGGRHQNDANGPTYSHGRAYTGQIGRFRMRARTMMHTFQSTSLRIPFFSNPNVLALNAPTGDANCCDVARRIGETAPRISSYRTASTAFTTGILGVNHIFQYGYFSFEPAINCGCAPYSTVWNVNFNSWVNYTQTTANDAPIVVYVYPGSIQQQGLITITMTVTACDGSTSTSFRNISVDLDGPGLKDPKGSDKSANFIPSKNINSFSDVFPNPTSSTASFNYNLLQSTHLKVVLLDGLGKTIKTVVDEDKQKGYYQQIMNVAELTSGLYFLQIISDNQSLTKKILINH